MSNAVRTTASALILRSLPLPGPGTDTGKRLINGQAALSYGETFEKAWQFVTAPAGSGWASAAYLEPLPAGVVHVDPAWPRIPYGLVGIHDVFGEPCKHACHAGVVQLPAPLKLSWENSHITSFECHELMAPVFTSVFGEIYRRGFWDLILDYGGCYECREKKDTTAGKPSIHSWGIGVDLNPNEFPLHSTKKQDARLAGIFADHGFVNGSIWARPDPMHWQYATGF